ncbi:MAG: Crp/Fnr family transcriptional regulator [Clostridia bacterium]|nr:Crp/Fnr family transcriptional regulator [Clostridia bacterium]
MKKYLKILRQCPLFAGIEEKDLLTMLSCLEARVVAFDKKYTVFAEGKPAKFIGIVLSGSVQIVRIDYYGNRSIIAEAEAGQCFGEAFACAEVQALPVTVIANEPCEVMLVDSRHIMHTCCNHCAFHQQLIFNLMQDLANKTLTHHQKIEVISRRTTGERLMTYLMLQAQKAGSSSFTIPFDRQELADYLEVDRSGLSAEISRLRKAGVLRSTKNAFTLL